MGENWVVVQPLLSHQCYGGAQLNMMIEITRREFATLIQEALLLACVERAKAFWFELQAKQTTEICKWPKACSALNAVSYLFSLLLFFFFSFFFTALPIFGLGHERYLLVMV